MHFTARFGVYFYGLCVLAACSKPGPTVANQVSHASANADAGDVLVAKVDAGASSATQPPLSVGVGFSDLAQPSASAIKENDAAVALLAKGKIEPAIAGFTKALELAPAFILARYNLACARARAGDMDGAERELTIVFDADWVGLRAQAARDEDLATFRASEQGKVFFGAKKEAELEARYKPAIDRGVRALAWSARDAANATEPDGLRAGVWDSATSRFIAVSERRRGELGAYVSSDLSYAVLVTGSVPSMLAGDMSNHFSVKDVTYWPYTTSGVPLATSKIDRGAYFGSVKLLGDVASIVLHQAWAYSDDPKSDLYELRVTFSPSAGSSKVVFAHSFVEARDPTKPHGTMLFPFHNGLQTQAWSAGYAWDEKKRELSLPSGKKIEIAKGIALVGSEPSIIASPKADIVALVWDSHSCGDACGDDIVTVGAHRIVLVDVATSSATKIAEGTGIGAVRFDPSGKMFVQRNRKVVEAITPLDATTWRDLPQGVLLVPPVVRESGVQCCGF